MIRKQNLKGLIVPALILSTFSANPEPVIRQVHESLVAHSNNRFGSNLYAQLCKEPGNALFSPYSIYTALAMPYAGAQGDTEKEMSNVLHITLSQNQFHHANAKLTKALSQNNLSIANKIFIQQDFPILPKFANIMTSQYNSGSESVDFSQQDITANLINHWVSQETQNNIKKIIVPSHLTPATAVVLVNAIYFKGKWEKPFEKIYTQKAPFCLDKNSCTDVDMMLQSNKCNYMENGLLQMIELPYQDSPLSMYVILPKELDGLSKIENQFTQAKLASWTTQLKQQDVTIKLPKFKLEAEYMLTETLASMGMPSAFSCANFTGITKNNLSISKVIHKASIEVEEEGTEASAATAVIMGRGFCRLPQATIFNADHPFIFLIKDKNTGLTLFMGKLLAP
ncbi:serpin family protein [Candidatus Dependentiae bacterium]|nr:serpin family protein [Candidatus Dependentiae bacterium]